LINLQNNREERKTTSMSKCPCKKTSSLNPSNNKRVCPTKNEPQQQGISYLESERKGVRERERGGPAGQAGIFKVRLGLGEIEGRDREIEGH
jgi:hypothetical protein